MAGQNQGGGNVDLFDAYFRRADLDQDGRISGAETVGFFQGSNLSKQVLVQIWMHADQSRTGFLGRHEIYNFLKQVLAQIWMHADQSRTGFLGRHEIYNFLKLVTVVQSKRDLTPDIVKATLYGPASSKIPAPQINLATTPAPRFNSRPHAPSTQVNSMPPSSPPQMDAVAPMSAQNFGCRGQVPPIQGVAGPNFPLGGGIAGAALSSSGLSTGWLGGRAGGTPSGATSQVPNRGISPPIPSVGQKPPDTLSTSSPMAAKGPKSSVGSGNCFASNSIFGGDI